MNETVKEGRVEEEVSKPPHMEKQALQCYLLGSVSEVVRVGTRGAALIVVMYLKGRELFTSLNSLVWKGVGGHAGGTSCCRFPLLRCT